MRLILLNSPTAGVISYRCLPVYNHTIFVVVFYKITIFCYNASGIVLLFTLWSVTTSIQCLLVSNWYTCIFTVKIRQYGETINYLNEMMYHFYFPTGQTWLLVNINNAVTKWSWWKIIKVAIENSLKQFRHTTSW